MRRICSLVATGILVAISASAAGLAFEVASIKKAEMGQGMHAGGGRMAIAVGMSIDGARVNCSNMSLLDLISTAYNIKAVLISGPAWLNTERFDINAKIPEGVKTDRVNDMLQTLLEERFKLTVHKENKPTNIYALIVGKDGLKLKETVDAPPADNGSGPGPNANGAPAPRSGSNRMTMRDGKMTMAMTGTTLTAFADQISRFTDRPVLNMTGNYNRYDMELEVSADEMQRMMRSQGMNMPMMAPPPDSGARPTENIAEPSGPSIFSTVQRYGLKLDPRKEPIESLVVDRIEKTPTEN